MSLTSRLANEQRFHDSQAARRTQTFACKPERLRFSDDSYLSHESWIRPAICKLGNVDGLDVLDYGCGHGMAAVVLARRGARVTGLDLSGGYIAEAQSRAAANDVTVNFLQADAEHLPFVDRSFDRVWGNAILHHLNIHQAGLELRRILRPGGIAVFCEPWGDNPLLNLARLRFTYYSKERTRDERPLRTVDIGRLRAHFASVELEGQQLLSMIRRICPNEGLANVLHRVDAFLLDRLPFLNGYCRYMILTVRN